MKRFSAQSDTTGEWQVMDSKRGVPIANGLSLDEAEETASRKNAEWEQEVKSYEK